MNKQILVYKKTTSITTEQFEAQVQQQKLDAIKWRELQDGMIYIFVSAEFINTQYGEARILTLRKEAKVFAPSALMNCLMRESNKPFPHFVRPKGQVRSKKNPAQTYYAFDLV